MSIAFGRPQRGCGVSLKWIEGWGKKWFSCGRHNWTALQRVTLSFTRHLECAILRT